MIGLFNPFERRSGLANPAPWLVDMFGGSATKSGLNVNPGSALEWVFDAVQVRSQTLAGLPLKLFRRKSGGDKEPALSHPLYRLVHDQPHPDLTSYEWRAMLNAHLDLRGNTYSQIVRDGAGRVRRLVPLHPDRVTIRRSREINSDGVRPIFYDVSNEGLGGTSTLGSFDMLHVRGFTTDGVLGLSPVRIKAETIGLGMASNEHAARMFSNGARPAGVLEHPAKLGDDGSKRLRESWTAIHGGVGNSGKIAILEEGMKFNEIGLTNLDAQLLESRKYSRTEIASMYRVPPHMLGDLERATFSNIEQQSIEFVVHCMLPIVTNWEQRLNVSLLSEAERGEYFFAFNLAGLLRGDLKSRYEAYQIGRTNGWLSANDIRETEDMNRIKGGDTYLTPMNMVAESARASAAIAPVLTEALGRAFRKEAKAVRALAKKPPAESAPEMDRFYSDHYRYLLEVLTPVATAARALGLESVHAEAIAALAISESRDALAASAGANQEATFIAWETARASETAQRIISA